MEDTNKSFVVNVLDIPEENFKRVFQLLLDWFYNPVSNIDDLKNRINEVEKFMIDERDLKVLYFILGEINTIAFLANYFYDDKKILVKILEFVFELYLRREKELK